MYGVNSYPFLSCGKTFSENKTHAEERKNQDREKDGYWRMLFEDIGMNQLYLKSYPPPGICGHMANKFMLSSGLN